MNIEDLRKLSKWLQHHGQGARQRYSTLQATLNHNASKNPKQPVSEHLDELVSFLEDMPLETLTSQQDNVLEAYSVRGLFGKEGSKLVTDQVRISDFDPATSAAKFQEYVVKLDVALANMKQFENAFNEFPIIIPDDYGLEEENRVVVRIQFKDDAKISNVVNWKSWSREWHDIVRGVALSIGEAPEETKIVGATNGSIIMVLASTYPFAKLLAMITKELAFVVKEGIEISSAIEDLRHKKILNKEVESALRKEGEKKSKEGVTRVVNAVKKALPEELDGDQEANLTASIKKFFSFNEKGGDVDFVEPANPDYEEDEEENVSFEEISIIRETIAEIRSTKEDILLLTNQMKREDDE